MLGTAFGPFLFSYGNHPALHKKPPEGYPSGGCFYRINAVLRVVLQLSSGAMMAAAGFLSHS